MLGERIREIRKSKRPKMSGEKLAELAELSVVTIYNLEVGKIPDVKLDTIDRVARALQVPIGVLTDDTLTVEAMKAQKYLRSVIQDHLEGTSLAADNLDISYGPLEEAKKKAGAGGKSASKRVARRSHKRAS